MNPQSSSLALISSQILYPLVQAAETKDSKIVKVKVTFDYCHYFLFLSIPKTKLDTLVD